MKDQLITWQNEDEAVITQWFFTSGDTVQEGDVVCEVTLEKTVVDIVATVSGELKILAEEDTEIGTNDPLCAISPN